MQENHIGNHKVDEEAWGAGGHVGKILYRVFHRISKIEQTGFISASLNNVRGP